MNQEPALNQNFEDENNRQVNSANGYQSPGYSIEESNSDDENNPWTTDRFEDGYQENIFEINFGDTPYTESAANPNPKLPGYASGSGYKSKKSQHSTSPELEL
ncbi:hypothetical protein [Anabaena catenula]|uniref:Uncharacterized protein n=1 Tax=Anabaena catenula FACHB-362 TaxID=2692877 RepID=A0ABR8J9L2_9NOST|nr:hypothetical protein [Anabaena catenula]MBD2694167.1 hypothetical protein [Anabaena catenula FACHB-362]